MGTDLDKCSIPSLAQGQTGGVQADKYITIIHTTSSNCCFKLKYESSIHNIACNKSGEKYPQIKLCLQAKMVQNSSEQTSQWILIWEGMHFFTGGSVIIMEPCTFWPEATVKSWKPWWWIFVLQTQSFSFDYVLTDGLDYLWIIVMFLSAVWTLILTAPIHCRGFIGEQVM